MSISSISGAMHQGAAPMPAPAVPPRTDPAATTQVSTTRAGAGSGIEAAAASVLSSLTPSDRTLIAAATGVVISPDGQIVSGAGYTASGTGAAPDNFAFVIAAARQLGDLQGKVTPQALERLFPLYIAPEASSSTTSSQVQQYVANATSHLSGSDAGGESGNGTLLDASA